VIAEVERIAEKLLEGLAQAANLGGLEAVCAFEAKQRH
jgi:hypothetical protein